MKHEDKSDEQLLAELADTDEAVRAAAAVALAQRRHPRALEACLRTLKDAAEPTHPYSTPAVWALVGMGLTALPPLLDRLDSTDAMTRLCANHAVMQITKRQFGFDGHDWPAHGYERWSRWWTDIGYEYDADATTRLAAMERMREACATWLRQDRR